MTANGFGEGEFFCTKAGPREKIGVCYFSTCWVSSTDDVGEILCLAFRGWITPATINYYKLNKSRSRQSTRYGRQEAKTIHWLYVLRLPSASPDNASVHCSGRQKVEANPRR